MSCENCKTKVNGNYCSSCGRPFRVRRIDSKYVIDEFRNVFLIEKGFLFTIKELFMRPGIGITIFLKKDRNRMIKPITFVILTSLIYSLINKLLPFEENYVNPDGTGSPYTVKLITWVINNYGYGNLLMGFSIAFFIKIFYWKYMYNIFEILILLCFTMGFAMLVLALFGMAENLTGLSIMKYGTIVSIAYTVWAISDFFGRNVKNYFKSLIAYLSGTLLFIIIIVVIGITLDIIIK